MCFITSTDCPTYRNMNYCHKSTHFPSLQHCHHNTKDRHGQNCQSIIHVVISKPQTEREQLEHIKWVQHFNEQELDDTMEWNDDFVVTIHHTSVNTSNSCKYSVSVCCNTALPTVSSKIRTISNKRLSSQTLLLVLFTHIFQLT